MDTNPEIRERILAAAQTLFEQSGRKELPTVDAVRKLSKTSMNDASAVMREWRRSQIVAASAAVVSVPEKVSQASAAALSTLWTEAQELANESLNVAQAAWDAERAEAEKLRVELSSAFETQGAELEALKVKLAEAEGRASAAAAAADVERADAARQVAVLTDQAHTATARVQEIEKRAEDLKTALGAAQASERRLTAELQASAQQVQLDWDHAYVGLRAGDADYTDSAGRLDADLLSAGELGTSTKISQRKFGGVLYAGVPFYQSLSLEVGFADLGTYPVQITTTSTNIPQLAQTTANKLWSAGRGFTAGLAAPIDLGSWFAIEPRLALLAYQSTQKVYTSDGTFSQDRKGLGADAGIAALLRPTHWLSLGAGVDCFETGGRCSVMLYSVELEYRFGR